MFKSLILFYVVIVLAVLGFSDLFGPASAILVGLSIFVATMIGLKMGKELYAGSALSEDDLEVGAIYEIESTSPFSSYFALAEVIGKKEDGELVTKVVNRYFYLPILNNLNPIVGPRVGDKFEVARNKDGKIELLYCETK